MNTSSVRCLAAHRSRASGVLFAVLAVAAITVSGLVRAAETKVPNIVVIYADDIGYGDVGCYGARGVETPNVDRLAAEGLRFTSAYATSATCTPSRYSLLTGEYAFRREGTGILPGNAALIIEPGRTTLPSMMRAAGLTTAVVGKWHLGLGAPGSELDWNGEIAPGPLEIGFEYAFIMAATGDRVPCVYVEDRRVVGLDPADPIEVSYGKPIPGEPTGVSHRDSLKMDWSHGHNMAIVNGIGRIGHMKGGKAALWVDEDMADVFAGKAIAFIERTKDRPFFLYFATHDIHVPRVPHARFVGKTDMGPRGDAIVQFDWQVGEILSALDRAGIAEDSLVILTSDNGPVLDDGYKDDAAERVGDHKPAGPFRGGKYSLFEAGTRVPFIVRWPGRVKDGAVSDALISQVDLLASLGALAGRELAPDEAPDSLNILPALLGQAESGRDHVIEHAGRLALREGNWKFIPGGKGARINQNTNTELGNDPNDQLYDLAADPGETKNLAAREPERVAAMRKRLDTLREAGRTRE